jgi:hypothetical protein
VPTRIVPESLWAYTHVPTRVLNDAGGDLTGSYDTDDAEQFADLVQDRIAASYRD